MTDKPYTQCQLKLILKPSEERRLRRWLYHLTGVWNWSVRKLEADAACGVFYSLYDFKALLNGHSSRMEIPFHVLTGVAAQAHNAWKRHRDGVSRRPRLKGHRNRLNSIPCSVGPKGQPITGRRISFLGFPRLRFHRQDIPAGHIGCMRLVRRASGWYLVLFIQAATKPISVIANGAIGIDPGFSNLLTTSAGEIVEHPNELRAGEQRIAQAQRGRRQRLTARLRERVANQRKDRNHKLSRRFVAENALIAWSKDKSSVIARRFGKSVASASHYQLRRMLAYKCSRTGGREFIEVASQNSTKRCSVCQALTGPAGYAGLRVRRWTCGQCGSVHDRDVNAALNVLAAAGAAVESRREAASGIGNRGNTPKLIASEQGKRSDPASDAEAR